MLRGILDRVIFACTASLLALAPSSVTAQNAAPRLSVAAAGGIVTPFHGDFDFTAPGWEFSLRGLLSEHVAIEGSFAQWRRTPRSTTFKMRNVGADVLAAGSSGRVTFSGGGGIGAFAYDRRASTGNLFSSDGFTVQGVAELDVAVARRVQVFDRYLLVLPVRDPGFGHGSIGGGVRLVLK